MPHSSLHKYSVLVNIPLGLLIEIEHGSTAQRESNAIIACQLFEVRVNLIFKVIVWRFAVEQSPYIMVEIEGVFRKLTEYAHCYVWIPVKVGMLFY